MPKASAHATRAVELDPALVEGHVALGMVRLAYDWNWQEAEKELQHEGTLRSRTIEAFSCALHFADPMGRNVEAVAALQTALASDPVALPTNLELGCSSYYGHDFDRAIRQFRETLILYPGHPLVVFGLGRAYSQKQMYADAITLLRPAKAETQNWPPIVAELAYATARAGNVAAARAFVAELHTLSKERFVDPYLFAVTAIGLGDRDQTFVYLNDAVEARSSWVPWLKLEPKWDSLHGDPRFIELLKKVGLPV
jgi:tetratricopeptide (TPR) repeat protein